jgi:hypothetical protein
MRINIKSPQDVKKLAQALEDYEFMIAKKTK